MLGSVRARLAAWHTAVLAVVLIGFATVSYGFLERTTARRTDRSLEQTAAAFINDLTDERGEVASIGAAVQEAVRAFRLRGTTIAVYDSAGGLVGASGNRPDRATAARRLPPPVNLAQLGALLVAHRQAGGAWFTMPAADAGFRVYDTTATIHGSAYTIGVAQWLHGQQDMLDDALLAYVIFIPAALLLAGLGGYLLARRSLRPVVSMGEQVARMSAANLHERLAVSDAQDELGQLAQVFNGLLARLEQAFEQQRRFMADASHELRTPVAIVRTEADVALAQPDRPPDDYRESLSVIREGGRRLSAIVDDLLLLARADAGQRPLRRTALYLDELVEECVRAVRSLAAQRRTELTGDTGGEAPCRGDEELLRRLIINLLDNAIKHSPPGSRVHVRLVRDDAAYRVVVTDTGGGIPAEAQPHIFDRFFRVDAARARGDGGSARGAGLGLAIARWVAEAHGGALRLVQSSDAGSEFEAELPCDLPDAR